MVAETIFVTTTALDSVESPWATQNFRRMLRAGAAYSGDDFGIVDSPESADFILFVDSAEPYLGDVFGSPLFKRFRSRSYVYNARDAVVPALPGIYPDVAG